MASRFRFAAAEGQFFAMTARSFCTVDASTKRNPDLGNGRSGAATANLASLAITPLWPVSRGAIEQFEIARPAEVKECYHVPTAGSSLPDIVEGDILTVSGTDYRVQNVGEWTGIDTGDIPSLIIVVHEIKGS